MLSDAHDREPPSPATYRRDGTNKNDGQNDLVKESDRDKEANEWHDNYFGKLF